MAKVLVALSDIVAALQAAPKVDVGGESHIEAGALLGAVQALTGGVTSTNLPLDVALDRAMPLDKVSLGPPAVELSDEVARYYSEHGVMPPDDSAERERLAALPPGKCSACTHIHPHGPSPTGCTDYVDSTVRDPVQARLATNPFGVAPGAAGIVPLPEPDFDPLVFDARVRIPSSDRNVPE